jgi:hypothetical protein
LKPDNYSDFAANEFRRQFGKTIRMTFSRLDSNLNILPFNIPFVAESFSEGRKKFFWTRDTDSEYTDRWFCVSCAWPSARLRFTKAVLVSGDIAVLNSIKNSRLFMSDGIPRRAPHAKHVGLAEIKAMKLSVESTQNIHPTT